MSQISLSSLLSQVGSSTDGSAKLRPSATNADAKARQDFASLIAGRMQGGSSSGSGSVDGAASAPASSTSVPVSTPENPASAFAQVFSQVSASQGRTSAATSTDSASGNANGSSLLQLVAQMRAVLARIHVDSSGAGTAAGSTARQATGAVGNLSLSDAIGALKDLLAKAGISPSALADGKSASAGSNAQSKGEGGVAGQTVDQNLASLLSLMKSLQTALKNQAQKLAQGAQATTDAGAAQLAVLQQLQQQLQQWGSHLAEMQQQNGSAGRGDLKAMLSQLQAALSTDGGRSSATNRNTAMAQSQSGQPASAEVAKSGPNGSPSDWITAIRQQHEKLQNRAAQHANTQGMANRGQANHDAGGNQGGASTSGLTAALSAAQASHGRLANSVSTTVGGQGLLGATNDQAPARDASASGAGLAGSNALGGAALSGVASAMTALSGSQPSTGIFGSGAHPQVNPQLAPGVGQQIQWMVGKSVSSASINLSPADLGPLKIHVQLQQDGGLQVQLMAHQHVTRDMLEQSLPRLRDWLQEAGLGQANVSVGADASGDTGAQLAQQQGQGSGNSSGAFGTTQVSGSSDAVVSGHEARVLQGPVTLLDLFA